MAILIAIIVISFLINDTNRGSTNYNPSVVRRIAVMEGRIEEGNYLIDF